MRCASLAFVLLLCCAAVANSSIVRLIAKPSCIAAASREDPAVPKELVNGYGRDLVSLTFDPCNAAQQRNGPVSKGILREHLRERTNSLRKPSPDAVPPVFEHAVAQRTGQTRGVQGVINLWRSSVALKAEYSLAMVRVVSGAPGKENVIEAGVHVFPELYGDSKLHFFVSWTADGYVNTGCYNLECEGFVQVQGLSLVGSVVAGLSSLNATQFEQQFLIFQIKETGTWFFFIEDTQIGHWPATLFNAFGKGASISQWGGEVSNLRSNNRHTATDMGSGGLVSGGFKSAAYIRRLLFVNENNTLIDASNARTESDTPKCYSVSRLLFDANHVDWSFFIFYGGPGLSSSCI